MSTTATNPQQEEEKIAQEFQDRLNQNPEYLKNLFYKTVEVSQSLYQKSPIHSTLIEEQAKHFDENFVAFLTLIDKNIYKTVQATNAKLKSLQSNYTAQKTQISEKINNSQVVKKTSDLNIQLIQLLEKNVNQLSDYLREQRQIESPLQQQALEEGDNVNGVLEQNGKVLQRYRALMGNVQQITFAVYMSYFQGVKQTKVYEKFLEAKIFQEIIVDICNEKLIVPINTNYVQPQVDRALVLKNNSIEYLNKQQEQLLQKYLVAKQKVVEEIEQAKVKCTVQFENTKKQVKDLLPVIQAKYDVLKGQIVHVYGTYFTVSFCQEFYAQNQEKIVEALKQLRAQLEGAKQKGIEYSQQLIKESQVAYKNALEEFQRRKTLRIQNNVEQSNKL